MDTENAKQRGRPLLPEAEKRTRSMRLPLSEKELAAIHDAADKAIPGRERNASIWARDVLLRAAKREIRRARAQGGE